MVSRAHHRIEYGSRDVIVLIARDLDASDEAERAADILFELDEEGGAALIRCAIGFFAEPQDLSRIIRQPVQRGDDLRDIALEILRRAEQLRRLETADLDDEIVLLLVLKLTPVLLHGRITPGTAAQKKRR